MSEMEEIRPYLLFAGLGYLSGSVLYAQIFLRLFRGRDVRTVSEDENPGTANAFLGGGVVCGVLALAGDLCKGMLPVQWALQNCDMRCPWFALVLAAPVIGHAWPIFFRFRGGKAIAVSFGVLLGIAPVCPVPLAALAFFYLFFSLVVRISPHAWRSIAAFLAAGLAGRALAMPASLVGGVRLIVLIVCGKHLAALHRNPEPVRLRLFHS